LRALRGGGFGRRAGRKMASANVPRGANAPTKPNHFASDSRVLRSRDAVKAPAAALFAKFFSLGKFRRKRPFARARRRAGACCGANRNKQTHRLRTWQKPAYHRYFCISAKFLPSDRAQELFSICAMSPPSRVSAHRRRGGRRLHTKLSGVTVIFFLL
jgi:hypothetical protein